MGQGSPVTATAEEANAGPGVGGLGPRARGGPRLSLQRHRGTHGAGTAPMGTLWASRALTGPDSPLLSVRGHPAQSASPYSTANVLPEGPARPLGLCLKQLVRGDTQHQPGGSAGSWTHGSISPWHARLGSGACTTERPEQEQSWGSSASRLPGPHICAPSPSDPRLISTCVSCAPPCSFQGLLHLHLQEKMWC